MGLGMVLLAASRREKAGWSTWKLVWFFGVRGTVLVALGFVWRAASLLRLIHPAPRDIHPGWSKGHMAEFIMVDFFQVMTCLGLQMFVLGFVLAFFHWIETRFALQKWRIGPRWSFLGCDNFFRFGFQPTCFFILGWACSITTHVVIHMHQHGDPATADPGDAKTFVDNLVRFLVLPGNFGSMKSIMAYPVIPWLGLSFWGCAMAFEFRANPRVAHIRTLLHGLAFMLLFPIIRAVGAGALNFRGWPLHERRDVGIISFFTVCKYPPTFSYISLTLGVDFVLLYFASLVFGGGCFSLCVCVCVCGRGQKTKNKKRKIRQMERLENADSHSLFGR
jgi:hypothetical protein